MDLMVGFSDVQYNIYCDVIYDTRALNLKREVGIGIKSKETSS